MDEFKIERVGEVVGLMGEVVGLMGEVVGLMGEVVGLMGEVSQMALVRVTGRMVEMK